MRILVSLMCALMLGMAHPAWAQVSRDDAAAAALRFSGGRVLAVERGVDRDNRPVWRVKVLTGSGDLKVVLVDPATGRAY
jgi:hypothetical protein